MTYAFDTLGFAKHLREAGIQDSHAEAHAEAVRDYLMVDLATKSDITRLENLIDSKIEAQTMRLTVRLGTLMIAGIGALAVRNQLG